MTPPTDGSRSRYLAAPVRLVRRALAPAALELQGQLPGLREENEALRGRLAALEERAAQAERVAQQLEQDLHESRRLNLRVAELVDLGTELVLPLHDREIDPAVLARLAPDTV